MTQAEQLSKFTDLVGDTGDIESIRKFRPQDATTNPSLILDACKNPKYSALVESAIKDCKGVVEDALDLLAVAFGAEIAAVVPGLVSTEVDARLSFDTNATVEKGRKLIALYAKKGITRDRILIKIASTWEGIRAAEILKKEGIQTNMTLLFCKSQAIACAEAGVALISPFVGRIMDWYVAKEKVSGYAPNEDPGVISVKDIYNYYKSHGYPTIVMGASFRNKGQILELAGCDKLTISPGLLQQLQDATDPVERVLVDTGRTVAHRPTPLDEASFRWQLNENTMATEKLAEGIRKFAEDTVKLEQLVKGLIPPDQLIPTAHRVASPDQVTRGRSSVVLNSKLKGVNTTSIDNLASPPASSPSSSHSLSLASAFVLGGLSSIIISTALRRTKSS